MTRTIELHQAVEALGDITEIKVGKLKDDGIILSATEEEDKKISLTIIGRRTNVCGSVIMDGKYIPELIIALKKIKI